MKIDAKMIARAHEVFKGAAAYSAAATMLNTSGKLEVMIPSCVNAALSLELYFKSLYILEKGVDFKINGRHSHNFLKIFDDLDLATKTALNNDFDAKIKAADMTPVHTLKKNSGLETPLTLRPNLEHWSGIFVNLRYLHDFIEDESAKVVHMAWFLDIEAAVRHVIFSRQPNWI